MKRYRSLLLPAAPCCSLLLPQNRGLLAVAKASGGHWRLRFAQGLLIVPLLTHTGRKLEMSLTYSTNPENAD